MFPLKLPFKFPLRPLDYLNLTLQLLRFSYILMNNYLFIFYKVSFARFEWINSFLSPGYPQSYDQVFPCLVCSSLLNLFHHGFRFLFATHLSSSCLVYLFVINLSINRKLILTIFLWERTVFLSPFTRRLNPTFASRYL